MSRRTPSSPAKCRAAFAEHAADVAVVVAYGHLLPRQVLRSPRHGCLNLHASLLPRWRGAAPIQRAIMAGDRETAASVMRMEEGLDTGPVCVVEKLVIGRQTTAGDLHDALARTGANLMTEALRKLETDALDCKAQAQSGVTYAAKIEKAEAQIEFDRPAGDVVNQIHGLSPWPGAWFSTDENGKQVRIKILRCERVGGEGAAGSVLDDDLTIACATGAIRPLVVQREGKAAMERNVLLRGNPVPAGICIRRI